MEEIQRLRISGKIQEAFILISEILKGKNVGKDDLIDSNQSERIRKRVFPGYLKLLFPSSSACVKTQNSHQSSGRRPRLRA